MAKKTEVSDVVSGEVSVKRLDVKAVSKYSPLQIIADHSQNHNRWDAESQPNSDYVRQLAFKMARDGNKDPVHVYRDGNALKLAAGYNRHAAGMLIVNGGEAIDPETGNSVHIHDPEFKLGVILVTGNIDDHALLNWTENVDRKPPTAMDQASTVRFFKNVRVYETGKIAKILGCDPSYVSQLEKLLILPSEIQNLVHLGSRNGGLSARAAMKMAEISSELRTKIMDETIGKGVKLTLDTVKKYMREDAAARAEAVDSDLDDDSTSDSSGGGFAVVDDDGDSNNDTNGDDTTASTTRRGRQAGGGGVMQFTNKAFREYYNGKLGPGEYVRINDHAKYMLNRLSGDPKFCTDKKHDNHLDRFILGVVEDFIAYCIANKVKPLSEGLNIKEHVESMMEVNSKNYMNPPEENEASTEVSEENF